MNTADQPPDREQAEESRRRNDGWVTPILESITDGMVTFDAEWRFAYINSQAERVLGLSRPTLLGKSLWVEFPAIVGTNVERQLRRAAAEKVTCEYEGRSEGRWYDNRVYPMPDGSIAVYFCDITERKRAEDELRRSEVLLAEAQQLAHIGSWNWDLQTNLLTWSDEHYRICGLERQEGPMTFERGMSVIHPDDLPRVRRTVEEALRDGTPYECSLRLLRPDGSIRFVYSRGRTVYEGAQKPVRMYGTMQDVTERVRAEEALRESETRFRGTFENAGVGIGHMNRTCHYIRVNRRFCDIVGYSREELRQATCLAITHPDDMKLGVDQFDSLMRGELNNFALEKRYLRKDGTPVWVNTSVSLQRDAAGDPAYAIEVIQDVSDRKRAEDELRITSKRLDLAMRGSNIGIWDLDLTHDGDYRRDPVRFINVWEQLGYEPAEFPTDAGASRALGHPEDLPKVDAAVTACLAGETEELRVENRIRHKDGSYRWLLSLGKAVRDASGKPVRLIGTVLDITERKRAEKVVREAKEAAEQANRVKDQFLATVSHELRAPLAAILLWSEILANKSGPTGDEETAGRAIRESAKAQQQLVEDLLDVSRLLAGEMRLKMQDIELPSAVQAALDIVRSAADAKGITIDQTLDRHAGRARADANRIQQVALNLLNNAVKFTPDGGRITVRLRRAGARIEIQVTDTGEGISPEFLPHVFERFQQGEGGATRRHGGLGLGLAIARELVELHGGTIRAESPGKDRGATFTIDLPLVDAAPELAADRPPDDADGDVPLIPSSLLRGVRALVVEDDETTREVIQYVLQQCEAQVTALDTAAAALREFEDKLKERRFDVVLSDIGLPEIDGHELMRQIRIIEQQAGNVPPTPAVALTAYAGEQARNVALAAGFNAHLAKPVAAIDLIRAVSRCARR